MLVILTDESPAPALANHAVEAYTINNMPYPPSPTTSREYGVNHQPPSYINTSQTD